MITETLQHLNATDVLPVMNIWTSFNAKHVIHTVHPTIHIEWDRGGAIKFERLQ